MDTVGLDEAEIRRYIKNHDTNEAAEDRLGSNSDRDFFYVCQYFWQIESHNIQIRYGASAIPKSVICESTVPL